MRSQSLSLKTLKERAAITGIVPIIGNSLIAAGDEDLVKIHFHTNEPWKILEYCNSIGEIYDIVVEDMIRQANGQQG